MQSPPQAGQGKDVDVPTHQFKLVGWHQKAKSIIWTRNVKAVKTLVPSSMICIFFE
jgi:hypothetical protein